MSLSLSIKIDVLLLFITTYYFDFVVFPICQPVGFCSVVVADRDRRRFPCDLTEYLQVSSASRQPRDTSGRKDITYLPQANSCFIGQNSRLIFHTVMLRRASKTTHYSNWNVTAVIVEYLCLRSNVSLDICCERKPYILVCKVCLLCWLFAQFVATVIKKRFQRFLQMFVLTNLWGENKFQTSLISKNEYGSNEYGKLNTLTLGVCSFKPKQNNLNHWFSSIGELSEWSSYCSDINLRFLRAVTKN